MDTQTQDETQTAVQCSRCKCYHASVADVRKCFNGERVAVVDVARPNKGSDRPTDKQWNFLNTLREQAGLPRLPDSHREQLTKRSISEAINDAKIDAELAQRANPQPRPTGRHLKAADYPTLLDGYYAVPSLTGNNDLDFLKIDIPSKGNWVGCLFVKRVLGGGVDGHRTERVREDTAKRWIAAVLDLGVTESMAEFGKHVGVCGKCHRTLTDDDSRARGIGPDCWAKYDF